MTDEDNQRFQDLKALAQLDSDLPSLYLAAFAEEVQRVWWQVRERMRQIMGALRRLWGQIVTWAFSLAPTPELSPALCYLTPSIRRRMAKRRARLVTRARIYRTAD